MYMGLFTVLIVRERKNFWNSLPSPSLAIAILADMVVVAALVTLGVPGVSSIPLMYVLVILGYLGAFSLLVNDRLKSRFVSWFGITGR
jgi:H+-transporting ATPase